MIQPIKHTKVLTMLRAFEKYYLLSSILSVLEWDASVGMPPQGADTRGKITALMSTQAHQYITSDAFDTTLKEAEDADLNETEKRIVQKTRKYVDIQKRVPESFVEELANHAVKANVSWEYAKEHNDFKHFEKDLDHMFALTGQYASYKGYTDHPYDALIDDYEEGMSTNRLKEIFGYLVPETVDMLHNRKEQHPNHSFTDGTYQYPKHIQEALSSYLMDFLALPKDKTRIAISAHPFTSKIGKDDVRITTRYDESDFISNMCSVMHESGHALYDLGTSDILEPTMLGMLNQLGLHESQSRTWENFVGRTREFCVFILPKLKELFPDLSSMTVEDLYELLNYISPSLIRTEADQVTYNLHIALRFDIEVGMLEGKYRAADLPHIWNEKMHEYLGITPVRDSEGVLQDVHWSYASIGYFPTYTLGNLYAAQLMATFNETHSTFPSELAKGDVTILRNWLRENLHQYGVMYNASEIMHMATGRDIDPSYLVEYLRKTYL